MAGKEYPGRIWESADSALMEIRKLQQDRRHRDAGGIFFIEGVRNFVQAIDHHYNLAAIIYSEKLLISPLARKFVRRFRRNGVPTLPVSPELFRTINQTPRASGVGAIVWQKWVKLVDTRPDNGLCWIILGQVRSPGNLGTLIRTSEAIGGAGFILLDERVDPYSPETVRASMGAIFRQQFARTNMKVLQKWIGRHQSRVIGASPDGTTNFHHFSFSGTPLLFLGEERQGLTPQQRDLCHHLVHIPMTGRADSLNLAVAGSLLLYEIYRSRNNS